MSIKHILLPLTGEGNGNAVALAALRLAKGMSAHVSAGYEDALGPLYMPTAGFIPSGPVFGDFYTQMQKMRGERLAAARRQFDAAVAVTQLPIVSAPTCRQASAMWIQSTEELSLSQGGTITDLAVVSAPGANMSPGPWAVIDTLLFGVGAPILLMPDGTDTASFRRPLIAWNGSGEALRALQRALALFPQDAAPVILQVGKLSNGRIPAARAAEYLGWHCVAADVRIVDGKDAEAAGILEKHAARLNATCVVMGAYTHGRTRQLLLGGLTDATLKAPVLPTFMTR